MNSTNNDITKNQSGRKSVLALLPILFCLAAPIGGGYAIFYMTKLLLTERSEAIHGANALNALNNLESLLSLPQQQLNTLTQSPLLPDLLLNGSDEAINEYRSRLTDSLPHMIGLSLVKRNEAEIDETINPPLNFASILLLKTSFKNKIAHPEVQNIDGKLILRMVAPITNPEDQSVIGGLLGSYDLVSLFTSYQTESAKIGTINIQQEIPDSPTITLYNGGTQNSHSYEAETLQTSIPHISLTYKLDKNFSTLTFNDMLFWVIIALMAFVASIAAFAVYKIVHLQVAKDLTSMLKYYTSIASGKKASPPLFSHPSFLETVKIMIELIDTMVAMRHARMNKPKRALITPKEADENEKQDSPPSEVPSSLDDSADAKVEETPQTDASQNSNPTIEEKSDTIDMNDTAEAIADETANQTAPSEHALNNQSADIAPASIFRAYDIRGIVDETLTADVVYHIGKAIGSEIKAQNLDSIAVGRDGRLSGPELSNALKQGIIATGCNVIDVGLVPTPILYFAAQTLESKSGVMLTGSHNPPNYNGLKIVINGNTLANEGIQKLYHTIKAQDFASGTGTITEQPMLAQYIDRVVDDVVLSRPLTVVIDCGNGAAGIIATELFTQLGCEVVPLYCEVDGNFPNHHPDPSRPENLNDLINEVKVQEADLGIAFDGDGDRLGVVTASGKIIFSDRLLMLFAQDILARNSGAEIIYDVKCTRDLGALITKLGGQPTMWKTGHSLIKSKLKETGAPFAGEMSGHIFFNDRWYGFDDALYSAARLLEIASMETSSTDELFAEFPEKESTPEINIPVSEENKFKLIEAIKSQGDFGGGHISDIDGLRVEYSDSWGLVRASNTTPVLVTRFEADSKEALNNIMAAFKANLLKVDDSLNIPF